MTMMIPAWVNGELTPVEKLDAHERGLCHVAVSVFVVRGTEILMQQRARSKYHTPELWANTCCTHPAFDEPTDACAMRRLKEELGITRLYPEFRRQLEYRADVGNGLIEHEVVDVYLAQAGGDMVIAPNPDEVMDIRWIDYHDLVAEEHPHPDRFTPWLKIYLSDYADLIFGAELMTG